MAAAHASPPLVVLVKEGASAAERRAAIARICEDAPGSSVCRGSNWVALSVAAGASADDVEAWRHMPAIARVTPISTPYRLASRNVFPQSPPVEVGAAGRRRAVKIGGAGPLMVMAAPVDLERAEERPEALVAAARAAGATIVHAGELAAATDANTRRITLTALTALSGAARSEGLGVCVEVSDARQIADAAAVADVLQVGARNMQNFGLLRELGAVDCAVLLRRSVGATLEEFLLAAEYVLASGNGRVILCESSLTGSGSTTRPRFEINAIPVLKQDTHLPVVADPSHATVLGHLVPAVARGAVAAGADGLCLEISESGAGGAIDPGACHQLVGGVEPVARVMGRALDRRSRRPIVTPRPSGPREDTNLAPAPAAREAADVLRMTGGTLQSTIASLVGTRPDLDVVGQMRMTPPYPSWLRWLLHAEGDLLVRWTRYRIGNVTLSRHVAYVDFGRVDPDVLDRLQSEELHLGQVLTGPEVDKFGFEFGHGGSAGELDLALRRGHSDVRNLNPYNWRRYIAATSGRVGFLVIEALPSLLWRRLLNSEEERLRLTAA
jgi:3-deoxy-7-phosphoheptulonate synthase